MIKDTS